MGALLKFLLIALAAQVARSQYPSSCSEALKSQKGSGVYQIQSPHSMLRPFAVYCLEDELDVRPWTVIQRRVDGRTDFFRNWEELAEGFGDLNDNFWLGLEKLHALTSDHNNPQELWIQIKDNVTLDARYSRFSIGNEFEGYVIDVGDFTGTAGNSLYNTLGTRLTPSSLNDLYGRTGWIDIMWKCLRDPNSLILTQMALRPAQN